MKVRKSIIAAALVALVSMGTVGCTTDAEMASYNISKAADQFQVPRRVVFFNGITDNYMLSIEGLCSIKADNVDKQLEVTCKVQGGEYKKHYLGLSDNVSYFVEQLSASNVSASRYKVIFKPASIIPDVDIVK